MAEGNGEMLDDNVKSEDRGDGERTEDYPKLIEYGLDKKVKIYRKKWLIYKNNNIYVIFNN